MNTKSNPIWKAEDSVLILIDYQPEVLDNIHDRDLKLVELNAVALTQMATKG